MNKQNIIAFIKAGKPYLEKNFGVKEIALFGSYARGEEKPDSDVDILVSLTQPSFSILMGLDAYLENKMHNKIDLKRTGPHLSNRFLAIISKDLIYV